LNLAAPGLWYCCCSIKKKKKKWHGDACVRLTTIWVSLLRSLCPWNPPEATCGFFHAFLLSPCHCLPHFLKHTKSWYWCSVEKFHLKHTLYFLCSSMFSSI
jgi:hypothetical protein